MPHNKLLGFGRFNSYATSSIDNYLVSGYINVNLNSHASKFKQIIVNVFGVYT